jgi:A32 protein
MLKNLVLDLEERMIFNHHENLPSSFRMLIIGSSGSGKTCLLLNMLLEPGFLDYDNLIIFTMTPLQQEYQLLKHGFSNGLTKESVASILMNQHQFKGLPIPQLMKKYAELHKQAGGITVTLTDKVNELIPPDKLDKSKKHLIIFDDCITNANQKTLGSFFNKGRHNSCNSIYLSQSYFDLDRMIRLNSNMLILFKLNQRNKADVYNSVIGTIMDKQKFYSLADNTWSNKYSYIVIDKEGEKVFTDIFEIEEEEN